MLLLSLGIYLYILLRAILQTWLDKARTVQHILTQTTDKTTLRTAQEHKKRDK